MTGHRVRFSCTLTHLDLEIGAGDAYGMIGANRAAKTITINLLLNVVAPTCGQPQACTRSELTHAAHVASSNANASASCRFSGHKQIVLSPAG